MTVTTAIRPTPDEHIEYYGKYIALATEPDAVTALETSIEDALTLLRGLDESKGALRYAPGKWSIRQVVSHVIDGERVFAYRALRIARGDDTPLPGFDENTYAEASRADERPLRALVDELELVRRSNLALFRGLGEEDWPRRGIANDAEISVRALAYIIAGHVRHHVGILRERYLAA